MTQYDVIQLMLLHKLIFSTVHPVPILFSANANDGKSFRSGYFSFFIFIRILFIIFFAGNSKFVVNSLKNYIKRVGFKNIISIAISFII